jgi:hypothetical protein
VAALPELISVTSVILQSLQSLVTIYCTVLLLNPPKTGTFFAGTEQLPPLRLYMDRGSSTISYDLSGTRRITATGRRITALGHSSAFLLLLICLFQTKFERKALLPG